MGAGPGAGLVQAKEPPDGRHPPGAGAQRGTEAPWRPSEGRPASNPAASGLPNRRAGVVPGDAASAPLRSGPAPPNTPLPRESEHRLPRSASLSWGRSPTAPLHPCTPARVATRETGSGTGENADTLRAPTAVSNRRSFVSAPGVTCLCQSPGN